MQITVKLRREDHVSYEDTEPECKHEAREGFPKGLCAAAQDYAIARRQYLPGYPFGLFECHGLRLARSNVGEDGYRPFSVTPCYCKRRRLLCDIYYTAQLDKFPPVIPHPEPVHVLAGRPLRRYEAHP